MVVWYNKNNTGILKMNMYYLSSKDFFSAYSSQEFAHYDESCNLRIIAGYSEMVDENTVFDISKVTYYIVKLPIAPTLEDAPAQYEVVFQSSK